ncbi:MAG: sulfur relay protein DsrC, partial [Desulfobia sp.]
VGPIDEEKMEIIRFMRSYYHKFNNFPILSYVCKNLDKPRECLNEEFVNPMLAWKLAGLPHMDGIEFTAVRGDHYIMQECC